MGRPRTYRSVKASVDKLMSQYIRSKGYCEHCGSKVQEQLQWCHLKSRKFLSVRWDEDNAFCLCASCHRNFHDEPDQFIQWIEEQHSSKLQRLNTKFQRVTKRPRLDELLDLEDELKEKLENT